MNELPPFDGESVRDHVRRVNDIAVKMSKAADGHRLDEVVYAACELLGAMLYRVNSGVGDLDDMTIGVIIERIKDRYHAEKKYRGGATQ